MTQGKLDRELAKLIRDSELGGYDSTPFTSWHGVTFGFAIPMLLVILFMEIF